MRKKPYSLPQAQARSMASSVSRGRRMAGIWKVPIDGGDAVPLTDKPASWPVVSPDGKLVACTYQTAPGEPQKLAIISIEGGAPLKTFDLPPGFQFNTVYSPDGRGVGYL